MEELESFGGLTRERGVMPLQIWHGGVQDRDKVAEVMLQLLLHE